MVEENKFNSPITTTPITNTNAVATESLISTSSSSFFLTPSHLRSWWLGLPPIDQSILREESHRVLFNSCIGGIITGSIAASILYSRRLSTPLWRVSLSSGCFLWGFGVGCLVTTPSIVHRFMSLPKEEGSLIKKDLQKMILKHNPNRSMEVWQQHNSNNNNKEK